MDEMKGKKPIKLDGLMERDLVEERILYDVGGKVVHVLNEVAGFVWDLCDGENTVDGIAKAAVESYDVSIEEARADIEACLKELEELSVIHY